MIADKTEKPQDLEVGKIVRLADGTPDMRVAANRAAFLRTSETTKSGD